MITEEMGKRLKELRESKKLCLKQMAKKIGIDYRTLDKYEKGISGAHVEIIMKYVKQFNVSLEYLFFGTEISESELHELLGKIEFSKQRKVLKVVKVVIESHL